MDKEPFPTTVDCLCCSRSVQVKERDAKRWSQPSSPFLIRVEMVIVVGWGWEWRVDGYACPECAE